MKLNTALGILAGKSSQFILKKLGRGTTREFDSLKPPKVSQTLM
ncbi:hypothetical protein [Streptococcus suis]|nr:hypothetical protein [Streptococcus suis]